MANGQVNVLDSCFCLIEDPFNPKVDPRSNFSFVDNKTTLLLTLNIFKFKELEDYFVKIGMFGTAVQKVSDFLAPGDYDVGINNAPSFLIEAPGGAGRRSLANQIAYQLKQYINGDCALETVPVVGEDVARLVFSIKKILESHVQNKNIPGCDAVFTIFPDSLVNPITGPDLNLLTLMFTQLNQHMLGAPPLILLVQEITDGRKRWISTLQTMLAPLNIVLIFLTSEYEVRRHYENLINGNLNGCWVGLEKMDQQSATDFLTARLDSFRKNQCDPAKQNVFPFDPAVFQLAFQDENKGVNRLLSHFRRAFNLKVKELNQHQQPELLTVDELRITWKYFAEGVRETVQEKVTNKN